MFFKSNFTRTEQPAPKSRMRRRLLIEPLENRTLMAVLYPNDPEFPTIQWGLNNTGQTGGLYDIDIDAPEAWNITTGSTKTVLAEIDSGVDFANPDVYLNIWLNQDEIPSALRTSVVDTDGDGISTFRDLNAVVNADLVTDLNGTGYIDGGDLLIDGRWANGTDDDGNGKVDDLVGWDFLEETTIRGLWHQRVTAPGWLNGSARFRTMAWAWQVSITPLALC